MSLKSLDRELLVVVGAGGVGKTTLAAALGLQSAKAGADTLVMTFDPSLRLKDALGVGEEAKERPAIVKAGTKGRLEVALLDAGTTFDRLIRRYAPDAAAAERIFSNRFYRDLAGNLAGILEYMAVERLFEVQSERRYARIILDTPPTRQALDFLEAPDRIVNFLDSGAIRIALKPWWEQGGGLRGMPMRLAAKGVEEIADRIIGMRLLGDMLEFFRAFVPLYDGFRERAEEVRKLLRAPETLFVLVSGPGADRIPDTLFFARKLAERGHHLGPIVVNQVHPEAPAPGAPGPLAAGLALFHFLGQRDREGVERLRRLLSRGEPLLAVPLAATPPTDLPSLTSLGATLLAQLPG
ncbi:MAG TPA: ArsA-related P-loop ATPase [Gemmatimonadales bacterium]|nr:ArsA-related P-loop ATPase [Gemmatimonadales bacterium]